MLSKHENWKSEPSTRVKARCTPKHVGNPSVDVGRQVDHRDLLAASLAKTEKKKKQKAKNMWGSGKDSDLEREFSIPSSEFYV